MAGRAHDDFLAETLPVLDLVYNLARRLGRSNEDAEDIVQETYLRAFEAWCRKRRPRKVEPWIATICLNVGRSHLRRASVRREIVVDVDPSEPDQAAVEDEAIARVLGDSVHAALWGLPEEQRIAITLMDIVGFTAAEVAKITGSPRGTVLSRVHRGRKKLARDLRKERMRHET